MAANRKIMGIPLGTFLGVYLLPGLVFLVVAGFLFKGLYLNPREIPSALIDRPVPEFDLAPVQGRDSGFASADLRQGQVVLVNIFASWCVPCRVEHPLLMEIAEGGEVPVYGINYKDRPEAAADFLDRLGDPYVGTGADLNGRVGIDWGVYGVPETFVVAGDGTIAHKHIGPLMAHDVNETIMPLVRRLQGR